MLSSCRLTNWSPLKSALWEWICWFRFVSICPLSYCSGQTNWDMVLADRNVNTWPEKHLTHLSLSICPATGSDRLTLRMEIWMSAWRTALADDALGWIWSPEDERSRFDMAVKAPLPLAVCGEGSQSLWALSTVSVLTFAVALALC